MKKAAYLVLFVTSVTAAFLIGTLTSQLGASPVEADRKVLHYACPMHPTYTSDHPGTAPCCGMAYEPVYEKAAAPADRGAQRPGAVSVPVGTQQLFGVEVEEVRRTSVEHALRLFGRVVADETRVYALNAGIEGTIRDVAAVTTGSRVRKNQLLATYTAPEILMSVQGFVVAAEALRKRPQGEIDGDNPENPTVISSAAGGGVVVNATNSNYRQRVDRLRLLGMSDLQMEEIKQSRTVPTDIKILSPIDGIVLARNVSPTRTFARGDEWFRIADLRRVWVVADVFGDDAARVRPGMEAKVTLPGERTTFTARVSSVPPQYNPDTRTRTVRLELENTGDLLRPDMAVDVELTSPEAESAVVVPSEAVIDSGLKRTVFVETGAGEYEPREVATGWRRDGRVEIVRGLEPGERIVRSGTFLLDSESRMRQARR